jgi:intein/homing endonuclease
VDCAEVFAEIDRAVSSASNIRNNVAYKALQHLAMANRSTSLPQVACQKKKRKKKRRDPRVVQELFFHGFFAGDGWMIDKAVSSPSKKANKDLWVVHRTLSSCG